MVIKKDIQGHTLLELVTVLGIMSILTAVAIPAGAFWIDKAKISDASGEFQQAMGIAFSAAIRNEYAIATTDPIAVLCLSSERQIRVLTANGSELPNCSASTGTQIWSSAIPEQVSITADNSEFSCLCLNSTVIQTNLNCIGCFTGSEVNVSVDNRSETLYVL